VGHPLRRRAD